MNNNYVKVALPLNFDQELTYSVPNEKPNILIGFRVKVRVGTKKYIGIITDTDTEKRGFKVRQVDEILDSKALFSINMIDFVKWIAKYYMCPIGLAFNAALPPSFLAPKKTSIKLRDNIDPQLILRYTSSKLKILQYLQTVKKANLTVVAKKVGLKNISTQTKELAKDGIIEIDESGKSNGGFVFEKFIKFNQDAFEDLDSDVKKYKIRSKKQIDLITFFLNNQSLFDSAISKQYLVENTGVDYQSIKKLADKGIVELILKKRDRSLQSISIHKNIKNELLFKPNTEQENAINIIKLKIENHDSIPLALIGVTGSGKTLVYIHSAKMALDNGGDVLIILPEIALTNQLLERFEKAFPSKVYSYHSKLDSGTRHDVFFSIQNDQKSKIILGTRSAIFAPSSKLKLIIIDEEHDQSLKQISPNPKYHARDCAVIRAKIEKCSLVLGSATPSIETWDNAKEKRYDLAFLKNRAEKASLPRLYVVDQINAKKSAAVKGVFSTILINKIFEALSRKEQIILFINRRGYSSFLECTNCGDIPMCKNCDIALTFHKNYELKCHICNFKKNTDLKCESCGKEKLTKLGIGTQKIESDLEKLIIESGLNVTYKRVDSDSISNSKILDKELKKFIDKKYDILIGTQYISKGLDIENVTLVGVINADLELYRNDFRANERTFQLMKQVAGRAGRSKDKPGEVVIQTNHPENYAISSLYDNELNSFYDLELEKRKKSAFPPLVRFCTLTFESKNEEKLDKFANMIFHKLNIENTFASVFEPVVPSLSKIKDYYRRMLVIKDFKQMDGSGRKVRELINNAISDHKSDNIKISIDIDSYLTL